LSAHCGEAPEEQGRKSLLGSCSRSEFALAADIVLTVIAPTWDDVGKLAVIATTRAMLNYSSPRTSPPSAATGRGPRAGREACDPLKSISAEKIFLSCMNDLRNPTGSVFKRPQPSRYGGACLFSVAANHPVKGSGKDEETSLELDACAKR
jgi:hypothetical protein